MTLARRAIVVCLALAGCSIGSNGLDQRAAVAVVQVTPATVSLLEGDSVHLVAVARDANGNPVTPRSPLKWSTADIIHVRVDTTGLVHGIFAGPAEVQVTADAVTASAAITVVALPAASVQIIAPQGVIEVGDQARFSAIVRNKLGTRITGIVVRWTTSDTTRANIDSTGLLRARAAGVVTVIASVDSAAGDAAVMVFAPVATVTVTPESLGLQYDDTARLAVTLRDSSGALVTGRPVTWSVGDSTVITLSPQLVVTSVDAGRAIVTATAGHASGNAVVDVAALHLTGVTLGGRHSCGLQPDGTAFCWGDGSTGALGRGDTLTAVRPRRLPGGLKFSQLSAGIGFTCGLTTSGQTYCWGLNGALQTGGTGGVPCIPPVNVTGNVCILSPTLVQSSVTFNSVVAGETSACGLTPSGAAYCWGAGGILGDSTTQASATPVAVIGGHQFRELAKPNSTGTCGLDIGGVVYCWSLAPAPLEGATTYDTLSGAGEMYCGLKAGDLYCWGLIPIDDFDARGYSPTHLLPGVQFSTIAVTGDHLCGVTISGPTVCWGRNLDGALGDATQISHYDSTGTMVTGNHHFTTLAVGGLFLFMSHSCGVETDGSLFCWGANRYGQVGRFIGSRVLTPVEPTGQP